MLDGAESLIASRQIHHDRKRRFAPANRTDARNRNSSRRNQLLKLFSIDDRRSRIDSESIINGDPGQSIAIDRLPQSQRTAKRAENSMLDLRLIPRFFNLLALRKQRALNS